MGRYLRGSMALTELTTKLVVYWQAWLGASRIRSDDETTIRRARTFRRATKYPDGAGWRAVDQAK